MEVVKQERRGNALVLTIDPPEAGTAQRAAVYGEGLPPAVVEEEDEEED